MAAELYSAYRGIGIIILLIQSGMLILHLIHPSITHTSTRWIGYLLLHLLMAFCSLFFLYRIRRARAQRQTEILSEGVHFSVFVCFWACALTLLDLTGGRGLLIYCYALPTIAALILLTPHQSLLLFSSTCLLLNLTLLALPSTGLDPLGNLLHSIVISVLSINISITGYRSRVDSKESHLIIQKQYDEIAAMNQKLSTLALTDQLTCVGNRRYLEETIQQMLGEPSRIGAGVAGMMVDVDFFKEYNDHYGHPAGDRCLRELAQRLITFAAQEQAFLVRYGGEEFFLCLFDCDELHARKIAELLRCTVAQCCFPRDDVPEQIVTVSVGLCHFPPPETPPLETLVQRADTALYEAKRCGRNRISTFACLG